MSQAAEMKQATPAHLHDGAWGVRVVGEGVRVGEAVKVTSHGGKTWEATISRIVWTGDGIAVCGTEKGDKQRGLSDTQSKPAAVTSTTSGGNAEAGEQTSF